MAYTAEVAARTDLEATQREIERTHGALEQVGGAVARERLRDAIEAFELAERQEREIEADYEAWLLLLERMKQADAAQASNLGQALAPAITSRFEALTQRRYENIRLTEQLGTEGVVVAGAVRATKRISVGTREQLSTLYRLSLAEYLCTTVVLDDQLVQSDNTRMDWFRALLTEKAHSFQIVVSRAGQATTSPPTQRCPKEKSLLRTQRAGSCERSTSDGPCTADRCLKRLQPATLSTLVADGISWSACNGTARGHFFHYLELYAWRAEDEGVNGH